MVVSDRADIGRLELPGALELGRTLKSRGILASIGTPGATYDDVLAAAEAGYPCHPHLFRHVKMKRVTGYRVCGVVEAGLP